MRPETEKAVAKFLAIFDELKRAYKERTGDELEMHKDTDPRCLKESFESIWLLSTTGAPFVGDVMNILVWAQCLGNGNHRTTVLFMQTFLNSAGIRFPSYSDEPGSAERFQRDVNGWTNRSQALIRRRGEWGFAQARLAPEHARVTSEWIAAMLEGQSAVSAIIGAQRLMNFIS